jgi:DeoR/GlpR family transcriptional regulator of sugar metabolism
MRYNNYVTYFEFIFRYSLFFRSPLDCSDKILLRKIMTDNSEAGKRSIRKSKLLELISEHESIYLESLSEMMGVSLSTIRRDLEDLELSGLISRKAGKVRLIVPPGEEIPFALRATVNQDEKRRIAKAALDLVQNGETVFIAGGSTALEFAQLLPGQRRLTVITHALRVASLLADKPGIELIILGGAVLSDEQTMHSHLTEWAASQFRASKLIYGVQAINLKHGLTLSRVIEVNTDRAIARNVEQIILLADHSKFGKVASCSIMPISDAHLIITGRELDQQIAADFEAAHIPLLIV